MRRLTLCCLMLVSGCLQAQTPPVLDEAVFFSALHGSQPVSREQVEVDSYRLPLSSVELIRGELRMAREERVSGQLLRATWRLPEGRSPEEVFQRVSSALDAVATATLFQCQARDCGSSNVWANNVFRERELYGLDNTQSFVVKRVQLEERGGYAALYVVQRGNRRVYARLDLLIPEAETGDASGEILNEWRARRAAVVPLRCGQPLSVSARRQLNGAAQALMKTEGNLLVVAHCYGGGAVATQVERSRQQAEQAMVFLREEGADGARLQAYGLGPLSTGTGLAAGRDRLELVLEQHLSGR